MAKNYVFPFVAYLVGTMLASSLPEGYYPLGYCVVAIALSIAIWFLWKDKAIFRPHWRVLEGIVVGVVGIVAWIYISDLQLERKIAELLHLPLFLHPPRREEFNPFDELSQPWMVYSFITIRMIGLAILVPLIEEVFWRGFLARWMIDEDWETIPLGTFTWPAFFYITALFTLAHPEWFAAAVYAVLINALFFWKKDLWPCIVAHAVSNLLLGIYVLTTSTWSLW